jgi:hypothetical protein
MTVGTLKVGGRKFRIVPESEFQKLCRQAKAGLAAAGQSSRKPPKTLKQMNAWMSNHWDEVLEKAKGNTKRLTGREVI